MSADVPGLSFTRATRRSEPSPLRSDVAGFIGRTRRGPVGTVVRVEGWPEYVRVFGGLAPNALTTYAIRGYFENGGEVAHVARVADPGITTAKAIWDVKRPAIGEQALTERPGPFEYERYSIEADSPGSWANDTRVSIRYRQHGASGQPELDIVVEAREEPTAYVSGLPLTALTWADDAPVERIRAGLTLIGPEGPKLGPLPVPGPQLLSWRLTLSGGDDRGGPATLAYASALAAIGERDEVALICVPDLYNDLKNPDDQKDIIVALVSQAEELKDRLVLVDLPDDVDQPTDALRSAESAIKWIDTVRDSEVPGGFRAAAVYHPRLWVRDPAGGIANPLKRVPPSGHVAGLVSRLDRERGAHYTPANATLQDAVDVTQRFTVEEQSRFNDEGINLLRCFPSRGLQVWGGRTLSREPSARFVAHRRLIHRLVRAIRRVAAPLVFDTNGPELWLTIVRAITTALLEAYRNGALKGTRPDEAFEVRCDETTTTPEERELGWVVCEIKIAPAAPMEFILLRVALSGEGTLEVFES